MSTAIRTPSRGEQKIIKYLTDKGWIFNMEHRFEQCHDIKTLPFDFYIPDLNILIEFQGVQHYEPTRFSKHTTTEEAETAFKIQQYHDDLKHNFAVKHGYKYLCIDHKDMSRVNEILDELKIPTHNEFMNKPLRKVLP